MSYHTDPTIDPGQDCDDHGPYADDDCPKCSCGALAEHFVWTCKGAIITAVCDVCYIRNYLDNEDNIDSWELVTNPDPDPVPPWPALCATCQGNGPCLACGAVNLPAIGRKIRYLMHNDANGLIALLNDTQHRWWPLYAHGYALSVGVVNDAEAERVVVNLWAELVAA